MKRVSSMIEEWREAEGRTSSLSFCFRFDLIPKLHPFYHKSWEDFMINWGCFGRHIEISRFLRSCSLKRRLGTWSVSRGARSKDFLLNFLNIHLDHLSGQSHGIWIFIGMWKRSWGLSGWKNQCSEFKKVPLCPPCSSILKKCYFFLKFLRWDASKNWSLHTCVNRWRIPKISKPKKSKIFISKFIK